MARPYRPSCPYDSRQAGVWYLPARWRYTTGSPHVPQLALSACDEDVLPPHADDVTRWTHRVEGFPAGKLFAFGNVLHGSTTTCATYEALVERREHARPEAAIPLTVHDYPDLQGDP